MNQQAEYTAAAHRLWTVFEPFHMITYFAPEARAATEEIGLRGYWRGYFATRLAPLGPIDAPVATAVLSGFSPTMVERAIPSVWALASPADALRARLHGVDGVLRRVLGDELITSPDIPRAASLARTAAASASVNGRPLYAANTGLPWPTAPHLELWQACTLLREHRGDSHVAALVTTGLDGCEAIVSHRAASGIPRDLAQGSRGWTDDQWEAAGTRLTERGWLDGSGSLTQSGLDQRAAIEATTDVASAAALRALTLAEVEELQSLLTDLLQPISASGIIPYPNPMGLPEHGV